MCTKGSTLTLVLTPWHTISSDEDPWTDWTDFLTLVSNLCILTTGPVYLVLNNPESNRGIDAQGRLRGQSSNSGADSARMVLQILSIVAVIGTCVIGLAVWLKVWSELRGNGGDDEDNGAFPT